MAAHCGVHAPPPPWAAVRRRQAALRRIGLAAAGADADDGGIDPPVRPLEPAMKTHPLQRAAALALALLVNLAMLGSIETLAGNEAVSPLWAAVVAAPRG